MKLISPIPGILRESLEGQIDFGAEVMNEKLQECGRLDEGVHGESPMRLTCDELDSLLKIAEQQGKLEVMRGLDDEARKEAL